jgi:dephospho-CoA kinase
MKKMLSVGLTGGIGSGKSTVSGELVRLGYRVIDCDAIAHRITEKGSPVLDEISDAFGEEVITSDGSLDRKAVAAIVFNDREKRLKLQEIVTRKVIDEAASELEALKASGSGETVFVDMPLLFETESEDLFDRTLVVTCSLEKRIERVMKRDGVSREKVIERINSQMPQAEKVVLADDVIDNSGDTENTYGQLRELLEKYEELKTGTC